MLYEKGFSLIELLVVLAITAILLMMAVPAYQSQSLKVQRIEGQTLLIEIQAQLERYFFDHRAYPNGLALIPVYADNKVNSSGGYYSVSLDTSSSGCPLEYCYILRAKPLLGRTENEELELHSNGTKVGPW